MDEYHPLRVEVFANRATGNCFAVVTLVAYRTGNSLTGESIFMDMSDIENGEYQILSPELQPGDAVVFDFRTVHGATGNQGSGRRRAFSTRFIGDDVRYIARPGRTSLPALPRDQSEQRRSYARRLVSSGLAQKRLKKGFGEQWNSKRT